MKLTLNLRSFAFCFLFLGGCCRWIFNGVIGSLSIQLMVLLIGLVLFALAGVFKFNQTSCVLLIYLVGIAISLAVNGIRDRRLIYYFAIVVVITAFSFYLSSNINDCRGLVKACVIYGVINTLFVLIQFFLGDIFNNILYSFLNQDAVTTAQSYYSHGNYFGFNYTPADAAGFIALAAVALIFWWILSKYKHKIGSLIAIGILVISLFITGKRGILFVFIISFILVMILLYSAKKQMGKALAFLAGVIFLLVLLYLIIINNQNVVFFSRINSFFNNLMMGENYDSGRFALWGYALNLWKSSPVFGVGWREFSTFSDTVYTRTHEVNCDYIQILCENGIVGLILFLIPIIIMLRRALIVCRNVYTLYGNSQDRWLVIIACYIQVFILIYAWIEIPFYDVTFYTLYIISCMVINRAYMKLYGKNRGKSELKVVATESIDKDNPPNILTT